VIAASRSLTVAGTAALLGAGLIASSAITPVHVATPRLSDVAVQLQSSVLDIFTFPAWQQAITNEVEFVTIRAVGLAEGGTGLAQSLAALPEALITATQQTLAGNALDALTTLEQWGIDLGAATLVPPVLANIDVGQIQLAIQSALLLAQPQAAVLFGSGVYTAFDTIARSFIIAGQELVSAVLSFNIGNIVQAVVDGVTGVATGFVTGGQAIVDGIVGAQTTLATALAARPVTPIVPIEMASVASAAAVAQITPAAPAQQVNEPTAAPAVVESPTAVDLGDSVPDAVQTPAVAVEAPAAAADQAPAPRRTSVRAAQRGGAETAAADTSAPTKSVAKRAARAAASN
jgi:hypothetical protein